MYTYQQQQTINHELSLVIKPLRNNTTSWSDNKCCMYKQSFLGYV